MAEIRITIPDIHLPTVLAALAAETGWVSMAESGITKAQNAQQRVRKILREKVKLYRMNQEHDAGQATIDAEMEDWT